MNRIMKYVDGLVVSTMCALVGCLALPAGTPRDSSTDDANLAVFSDPDSDFTTTDVHDIDEQIVRFDTMAKTMIWVEDDLEFADWDVDGNFLGTGRSFQVRFGTNDGQRRAYFTETGPATICNIFVENDRLFIFPTSVTVPQE